MTGTIWVGQKANFIQMCREGRGRKKLKKKKKAFIKIHGYQSFSGGCPYWAELQVTRLVATLLGDFPGLSPQCWCWAFFFLNDREMKRRGGGEGRLWNVITILTENGNFSSSDTREEWPFRVSCFFCLKQRGSRRMLVSISPHQIKCQLLHA